VRALTEQEMAWKHEGTLAYQTLARRCQASLVEVEPLDHADPARPRLSADDVAPGLQPLVATKAHDR